MQAKAHSTAEFISTLSNSTSASCQMEFLEFQNQSASDFSSSQIRNSKPCLLAGFKTLDGDREMIAGRTLSQADRDSCRSCGRCRRGLTLQFQVGNLAHPSYQSSISSVCLFLNALVVPASLCFQLLDEQETDLPEGR